MKAYTANLKTPRIGHCSPQGFRPFDSAPSPFTVMDAASRCKARRYGAPSGFPVPLLVGIHHHIGLNYLESLAGTPRSATEHYRAFNHYRVSLS